MGKCGGRIEGKDFGSWGGPALFLYPLPPGPPASRFRPRDASRPGVQPCVRAGVRACRCVSPCQEGGSVFHVEHGGMLGAWVGMPFCSPLTSFPHLFPYPLSLSSSLIPSSLLSIHPPQLHCTHPPILFTNPTLHIPLQSSTQLVVNCGVLAILSTPCPHAPYCHRALVCRPNDT